ncbi:cingulin-like [Huso huso]|uniref:Cingulin-like n=1 Tax=Huso huso TaxID=61971 RepID=A0ABR0Z5C6_HUSHU
MNLDSVPRQLTEVKEQLARGEEENEALRNCKLELTAEVERLSATVCSMNQEVGERGGVLTGQADQRCQELESQLSETRVQLRQCQDTVAEGQALLQAELDSLRIKLSVATKECAVHFAVQQRESLAAVCRLPKT